MAMPSSTQPCQLFDLPDEILGLVAEHLNQELRWNGEAVSSFRQTCKLALKLTDPAWCRYVRLTRISKCEGFDAFLATHPRLRSYVHNLEIEPAERLRTVEDAVTLLQSVSQFPNLQYLSVKECCTGAPFPEECVNILNQQLQTTTFDELCKCYLQPGRLWDDHLYLRLDHLLQAPKLTSLTLCGVNLVGFEKSSVASHSTILKNLTLTSCVVDRHSLSAFLSKPCALESVHFGGLGPSGKSTRRLSYREDLQTTQLMLEILRREQPKIHTLRISFKEYGMLGHRLFKGDFDFEQLSNLKSLSLGGQGGPLIWPTGEYENGLCWPTNAFDLLPAGIESIKFHPPKGKIDLEGLALTLSGSRNLHEGVPVSLQQLEFLVEKRGDWGTPRLKLLPQRPLTEKEQITEDSLKRGIDRLMTALNLEKLTYVERYDIWPHKSKENNAEEEMNEKLYSVFEVHYSFRKITATRNDTITEGAEVSSCSSLYNLKEVIWEEFRTMYDHEYRDSLESEAY